MTIGELKVLLRQYPDDMEIATDRYSDMVAVEASDWTVVEGVEQRGKCWIMQAHPTMSAADKAKVKSYLHLKGN